MQHWEDDELLKLTRNTFWWLLWRVKIIVRKKTDTASARQKFLQFFEKTRKKEEMNMCLPRALCQWDELLFASGCRTEEKGSRTGKLAQPLCFKSGQNASPKHFVWKPFFQIDNFFW